MDYGISSARCWPLVYQLKHVTLKPHNVLQKFCADWCLLSSHVAHLRHTRMSHKNTPVQVTA